MEAALGILAAILAVAFILVMRELQSARKQLREYKELFELGDAEYKKAQERAQRLLEDLGAKNVIMERASQALEIANNKIVEQDSLVRALDEKLKFQEGQYAKLLGQKKSSEVRTGKIAEQISPFLDDYPLDPSTARFIGDPIDFVHFDKDKVTFVEVKSGRSQLSKKQRIIRDMIKEGRVDFILYRIKGEGDKGDKDGDDGSS